MSNELDPIMYEIFERTLISVLEEGREAVGLVSGTPAIVEGGEFMTSAYEEDGKGIICAAGTQWHVIGSGDAVRYTIREYEDNPGIDDGDQFFFNDPYIAGTHLMDQIMVKPIFSGGKRVAWVGVMTHTGDVGGLLRGLSTEIFHEGVNIRGLKLVEKNRIRKDIQRAITQQCRDPEYVTQDLLARIAANNVCADGYLRLVDRFGIEFVKAASIKLREDAEKRFREKLKGLPDGTWRERVYMSTVKRAGGKVVPVPLEVVCTVTKKASDLKVDISASPQTEGYTNAALPCSRSCIFAALAATLLWDIPWNADLMEWVDYNIPEGTFVNCRFPASCGLGTTAGLTLIAAVAGCMAKMMYAAGFYDYVNASWGALGAGPTSFGPGVWFGGHDQHGRMVAPGIYDTFAGGQGATPYRDGNNTGGVYVNPRSASSDVEWTESYYPLLYLAQRHGINSSGYGKFRGGLNLESVIMVYGTKDLTVNYLPGPEGGEARGFGLFGGYPTGGHLGDSVLLRTSEDEMRKKFSSGMYPVSIDQLGPIWGVNARKSPDFHLEMELGGIRVGIPEGSLIGYSYGPGGGYGDPLDRDPSKVVQDVKDEATTVETASKVYGVVIDSETLALDLQKTEERRREIRQERIRNAEWVMTPVKKPTKLDSSVKKKSLMRMHEYLEIVEKTDGSKVICCVKCGNEFCGLGENYKKHALRRMRDIREMKKVGEGEPLTHYQEYICPGCSTLLQVDPWCPLIDTDEPLWDIDVKV